MSCSKTGYATGVLAHQALEQIQGMDRGTAIKPTRFYRCDVEGCGLFHLTSTPKAVERRNRRGANTRKRQFPQPPITGEESVFKGRDRRWSYDI